MRMRCKRGFRFNPGAAIIVFVFVLRRVEMVDSVLHAEPYTKEELCKFFGLTVCCQNRYHLNHHTRLPRCAYAFF